MDNKVFLSHSSKDKAFVIKLRKVLEVQGIDTWMDSRELCIGDFLTDKITSAINDTSHFIVVLSHAALNSEWVDKEVKIALGKLDTLKVIALVFDDVGTVTVNRLIPKDLLRLPIKSFDEMMSPLFTALGEQLPNDWKGAQEVAAVSVEELVLQLSDPTLTVEEGRTRLAAKAQLFFYPSDNSRTVKSKKYDFEAPIGEIEAQEITWYVESYFRWPTGVFKTRAQATEKALPQWGETLYQAALSGKSTQAALNAWQSKTSGRRFSVEVESDSTEGETDQSSQEAASRLLALPWEIMHDGVGFLNHGANAVHIRRRLPNYTAVSSTTAKLPIRVLLLSPRPEKSEDGGSVGYIDHRSSALPLVQAMENLGTDLVKVDLLQPPTFSALQKALKKAKDNNDPYEIVHFDGHGVYDKKVGLGALCFEHPSDENSLQPRLMQLVDANELAAQLRHYGVPLVYLDACQTAKTEEDPKASVAAKLLEHGVGSVVAMSHSVLVTTAEKFVEAFYQSLAEGKRVGDAMLAGQKALYDNRFRMKISGAGKLNLQDWFVPVLYQEAEDPQLFNVKPGESAVVLRKKRRKLLLGELPETPKHGFVGRSYALLQLERLLQQENYAVIQGVGGMGKTAIAIELVRWLVRSGRFGRAVFISVESQNVQDVKGIIDKIGHQLLPKYAVTTFTDTKAALQPIERELSDTPTLFLFDNMESVLPDQQGNNPAGVADVTDLLALCNTLLQQPKTSVIFTSREALPEPFNSVKNTVKLGRLTQTEAIELVEKVMAENGYEPPESDDARTHEDITNLVDSVNCHPRALVLLAKEVKQGIKATTANLAELMAKLEKENPNDRENSLYA
ncbi:MAG: CHAT domain-containing protein, partial [Algicola sp.]|nr:CHAT domain-containing protein [Algicola sp.]